MTGATICSQQFLYDAAPFPSCHAATLVETGAGMIAAFFGGTREGAADVAIWLCRLRRDGVTWTPPERVADGAQPDGSRQPCWNPVLFQPRGGPVMLFHKVGPSPSKWWGMAKSSADDGRTWSEGSRLPDGILGPIKNKPVQLQGGSEGGGDIISPCSVEGDDVGWRVYFERSTDGGRTWTKTSYVEQDAGVKAIQPSVLVHSATRLQAIGRTKSKRMFTCWSDDAGKTWGQLSLIDLPNPNSGTDAVTLADGRHLLVYNHSDTEKVRYPLNVALSRDGTRWEPSVVLEHEPPGQYSYPAVVQARDGLVHVVYTWKRLKMRHAVVDVARR